jgi:hypothetical protein
MLLLASSVCGLFKWRQFEPEVILLAVGWYLRFSLSYRDVRGTPCRARPARRSRHGVEVGPANARIAAVLTPHRRCGEEYLFARTAEVDVVASQFGAAVLDLPMIQSSLPTNKPRRPNG